jgi:hypothetical protein
LPSGSVGSPIAAPRPVGASPVRRSSSHLAPLQLGSPRSSSSYGAISGTAPAPIQGGASELVSGGGPAAVSTAAVTELTRLLRKAWHGLDATRLRALLGELHGCLTMLPPRSQKVLRLRAGMTGSRPLSVHRIAMRLHISAHRVIAEEISALRKLRTAVQTSACEMTGARQASTLTSSASFPGVAPLGNGGVADALYLRAATTTEAPKLPGGTAKAPPGVARVNPESSVLLLLIIAAGGALLVGLLAAESLGVNPLRRHFRRGHRR